MISPVSEIITSAPAYYQNYIRKVEGQPLLELLEAQKDKLTEFFWDIPAEKLLYRYADGKWSIKEILGHIIDTERIMSYRMLRFARNDQTALPGFEEDDYVSQCDFDSIHDEDLLEEFMLVRESSLRMIRNFSPAVWKRGGIASGQFITVEALACILGGHIEHHLEVVRERYL